METTTQFRECIVCDDVPATPGDDLCTECRAENAATSSVDRALEGEGPAVAARRARRGVIALSRLRRKIRRQLEGLGNGEKE